jgi:hypothetical protein
LAKNKLNSINLERISIKNKPICVLASLADVDVTRKNGIYELDNVKIEYLIILENSLVF